MDVDGLRFQIASKNNIRAEKVSYMQSIGARGSAMEHLVPEQMFSTETEKAQGISAVKALAIASQQGQKIWTITNDNVNLALSRINLGADAENDIRNAVNAGKIATAHETRINFNGWVGEGYTLIDPNTGAGAYMISGGGNGGELFVAGALVSIILGFVVAALFATGIGAILVAGLFSIFAMYSYTGVVSDLLDAHGDGKLSDEEFIGTVKLLSFLTIVSSFLGIRGTIKKDEGAEILHPLFIDAWAFLAEVGIIWPTK